MEMTDAHLMENDPVIRTRKAEIIRSAAQAVPHGFDVGEISVVAKSEYNVPFVIQYIILSSKWGAVHFVCCSFFLYVSTLRRPLSEQEDEGRGQEASQLGSCVQNVRIWTQRVILQLRPI